MFVLPLTEPVHLPPCDVIQFSSFSRANFYIIPESTKVKPLSKSESTSLTAARMSDSAIEKVLDLSFFGTGEATFGLAGSLAFINGENAEVAFVGSIGSINVDYTNVVSVFPNPASSFVQVITPELASVQLMDASGRIISTNMNVTAGQALTLSTAELASGVYFVKIRNDNFSVNKKIVVNN